MLSDDVEKFERAEKYRERISLMKFKLIPLLQYVEKRKARVRHADIRQFYLT